MDNNILGNYIKRKRKELGLSLRAFGELCQLSHTYIDSIEKGIDFRTGKTVSLSNESSAKIADALGIKKETLYYLSLKETSEKFSFYYDYVEREDIKEKCYEILSNKILSLQKKVAAAEEMLKAYYSRSIEANQFDVTHLSFEEYSAMLIQHPEFKERFGEDIINILKEKFGDTKDILTGTYYYCSSSINDNHSKHNINSIESDKNYLGKFNNLHQIPILGYISAGLPIYAEQHIEGYTYTDLNNGGEYFGLRVKGDSMNALRICEGDVIIVRKQDCVENGEIAVVMVDDENATVKQFYREGNAVTLIPKSTNPEHTPQFYNLKNTNVKVIGKVVRNQIDF